MTTIIVLLILAGVTVATITGENGLLSKTQLAKEQTTEAENDEKDKLSSYENELSNYSNTDRGTVTLTDEQYQGIINRLNTLEKYKSGTANLGKIGANSGAGTTITLDTPLENTNYSVVVTCTAGGANWATVEYLIDTKTVNSFRIYGWNHGGGTTGGNVIVDWILIPYKN